MFKKIKSVTVVGFISACFCMAAPAAAENTDLNFFVLVKSSNYAQDVEGNLKLLNFHFFSELFPKEGGSITSAKLTRVRDGRVLPYVDRGSTYYYEGGHFNSVAEVDAEHANGAYRFDIVTPSATVEGATLSLAGPNGSTDIPAPITIYFEQDGAAVRPDVVDPMLPLRVTWSPYSNGRADPNHIVDDMIFVVFQDCFGNRVFHTGLPFKEENYLTYRTTDVKVPTGTLKPGRDYAMFVEMPHVADSIMVNGVPGFTSFATATYLDLKTKGESSGKACPAVLPPLDTGQTDRMEKETPR